jgi:hypothetical protein
MNYRLASILPAETANSATTKTIDLRIANPISRITVQMKGLNSSSDPTAHPAKMISKIEVVDGSDVLFSLSGLEAQALNFNDKGYMPHTVLNYYDNAYAIATFDIDFGRYLWDPVLALDPTKFTNPQLKITHTLSSGGSAPDAAILSVFGHAFDQKEITPTGFLMAKEQYSYTLSASANESIDLATDYPYRKLLIKSLSDTLQPWQQYNQLKLSEDSDKKVLINDEKVSDLLKLFVSWPAFTEQIFGIIGAETELFYCAASYEKSASILGITGVATAYINDTYGSSVSLTDGTGGQIAMLVNGSCPHGTLCIPFGDQNDVTDWYKMDDIGSLRMTLKAGSSASGTCEVTSQQYRAY